MSAELTIAKSGAQAARFFGMRVLNKIQQQQIAANIPHFVDNRTMSNFLLRATPAVADELSAFMASPQLDYLAVQMMSWHIGGRKAKQWEALEASFFSSFKRIHGLGKEDRLLAVEIAMQLLLVAVAEAVKAVGGVASPVGGGVAATMAARITRDTHFVERVQSLADVNTYTTRFRSQVASLRSKLRLTHLGSGPVTTGYGDLHVEPSFQLGDRGERRWSTAELLAAHLRLVVLGDPGAGKSTLAAKLAHDLATDVFSDTVAAVPFLFPVREHADALVKSGTSLVDLLEVVSRNPYGVPPPPHAVEYLLISGAAIVIVDGVDELGSSELRRRFAELLEGFAHMYPLAGIVVTSRIVGYDDAPLDPDMFVRARVAPFTVAQCTAYARRWFALDDESSPVQQEKLAQGFITESAPVPDLRSNPLLLSLLCSLYSSKHYIPRHRTEIYEQCAELLYERWDSRRDIEVPLKYQVDVRPAIATLAWMLLCDPRNRQALPKNEILAFLIRYMRDERFETNREAQVAAEDFLKFCAGRAWVLTEVGTVRAETIYGFTHRTFLEYFAALHLVREKETVDATWHALRGKVNDASWSIVNELAVQILDRNNHGGANRFVEHLVNDDVAHTDTARLTFAVRLTSHLTLRNSTLIQLCERVVERSCAAPPAWRRLFNTDEYQGAAARGVDEPLTDLLLVSLPENAGRVASYVVEQLWQRSTAGQALRWEDDTAAFLLAFLRTCSRRGNDTHAHIAARLDGAVLPPAALHWERIIVDPGPDDVEHFGVASLYMETLVGAAGLSSNVQLLLTLALTNDQNGAYDDYVDQRLDELYEVIVRQPWPWLRASGSQLRAYGSAREEATLLAPRVSTERFLRLNRAGRSAAIVLLLPYAQLYAPNSFEAGPTNLVNLLCFARYQPERVASTLKVAEQWDLYPDAWELLGRYLRGERMPVG